MGMEGVVDFDYDKTDRHDITEILLKVALNIIKQTIN
jgi:hypothetical protein